MEIRSVSLKDFSSLRIGGEGKLVVVTSKEELHDALMHAKAQGLRVHLLGGGTNSYFGDDLSEFLFVKPELIGIEFFDNSDEVHVRACSSVVWDELVQACVDRGLWGIENLSYIPGTVGAAPVQNIGAYGVELTEVFFELGALNTETLEHVIFTKEMCQFGYRDSIFKQQKGKYIITDVTLTLRKASSPVLLYKPLDLLRERNDLTPRIVRDEVIKVRTSKLPNYNDHPNAGSFFKNPIVDKEVVERVKTKFPEVPLIEHPQGFKVPAGWLIEHVADMKGVQMGDVGTWPNQSLVLVNYGNATADHVDQLANEIRERVNAQTGIVLEQEVNRVG